MKFKYFEYETHKGLIKRPGVSLLLKNGKPYVILDAIVDSGSDFSIFPIEIAGQLNIKLNGKTKESFIGAGNNPFTVYKSPIEVEHVIMLSGFRPLKWKSVVYFAESQPAILLGHHGFLDRFKIILDGKKQEMEII
jgi:hypothetical protein